MIDIDAEVTRMLAKLPDIPAAVIPKDLCDKPFMAPQAPAHYVVKTIGGPSDVCSFFWPWLTINLSLVYFQTGN